MAFCDKKIIVVLPAYNAHATLKNTLSEMPKDLVDHFILVDDASSDDTAGLAKKTWTGSSHSSGKERLWRESENVL